MKEKYKLRLWVKLVILVTLITICTVLAYTHKPQETKKTEVKEIIVKKEKVVYEPLNEVSEGVTNGVLEVANEEEEEIQVSDTYTTRMTSFWSGDECNTGSCTGSGLCEWDLQVNDKGWYTYQGKLVIATATTYLANQGWYVGEGVHLYKYGDEVTLTIDGVEYDAIVKDSCGNCMRTDRVDLFVSNGSSARDTMVEVRRK